MRNDETQLLVVDDDAEIRDLLANYLARENFRVLTAKDGESVDRILAQHRIQLIVLDLMMPGEDGLSICRRIRVSSAVPIIILTAKGEDIDRIIGLEMGADDYISKPFNPRELVARIKAVLWRAKNVYEGPGRDPQNQSLAFDGWVINQSGREVISPDGTEVVLSSGEFNLLVAFASNPKRVLTRDQLLDLTQGRTLDPYDRSIDVQVSRLRRKIERDPQKPSIIKTVHGVGYTFIPTISRI